MILCYEPNSLQIYQINENIVQPCQQLPNTQSKTLQFQDLFPRTPQAQRIVISISFYPYGRVLDQYTILSIHQSNICIVSISYKLKQTINEQSDLYLFLKGQNLQSYSEPKLSYSNQLKINLNLKVNDNMIFAQISVQSTSAQISGYSQIQANFNSQLKLNELELNYGNPHERFNLNPSCSLVYFLSIGISTVTIPISFSKAVEFLGQQQSYINQNYDYFYSQSNPGKLISSSGNFQQAIQIQDQQPKNIIRPGYPLKTIFFDLNLNQFMISFYIKLLSSPTTKSDYFCIQLDLTQHCISFDSAGVYFKSFCITINPLSWNYILIIKNQDLGKGQFLILINNSSETPYFFTTDDYNQRFQLQFYFSNVEYQLNHIRIYQGSLLYESNQCALQASDGSCLSCKSNNLINFQNSMQCVEKDQFINRDSEIQGVKDWNQTRKLCLPNMINDSSFPNECICLTGFYQEGNNCIRCPSYCRNCKSLNDCNQIRNSQGNCLNINDFNDGKNCITPLFILKERTNIRIKNEQDFGSQCMSMSTGLNNYILPSNQLNLSNAESIFFSFSIQVSIFNLQQEVVIAYILDDSVRKIHITLSFQQINTKSLYIVKFYVKGFFKKKFTFEEQDFAWIAFWTDNQNCYFLFKTKEYNYYDYDNSCSQLYETSNLQICTGKCDTENNFCLVLKNKPLTVIKNIPNPTLEGIDYFFTIFQSDNQLIGRYKFDENYVNHKSILQNSSGNPSTNDVLNFISDLKKYNQIQGFQLDKQVKGIIVYSGTIQLDDLFTIFLNLEFNSYDQISQFSLLQIENVKGQFVVYIIPDYLQQVLYVQICYQTSLSSHKICQTLKKAILLFDKSNFFFISVTDDSIQDTSTIALFNIKATCNYIQETIQLKNFLLNQVNTLQFGDSQNENQFFIDNIHIYPRNVFVYYDYTQTDPCFIYINLENMKCLYLKKDYLYFNNQIITKQQCFQQIVNTQFTAYIIEKEQTCNIKIPFTNEDRLCGLIEYVNGIPYCSICKDKNLDPKKQCLECKEHFFLNQNTLKCQQCDEECVECKYSSSNCTQCKYINQITPTCNCIQQNITSQNICSCNYKCKQCSILDNDFCFECSSENRVLPSCECDYRYQEINQKCVKILQNCSSKCHSCADLEDNCTYCSQNRINPPLCNCTYGFQEQVDGTCQPCSEGNFYDPQKKICKQCSPSCISCNYQQCFQCQTGYQPQGFYCNCQAKQNELGSESQDCLNSLNLKISSFSKENQYYLEFSFSQILKQFEISDAELLQMITFYIPEIPENYYSFINPRYFGNKFQVNLEAKTNFYATEVVVIVNTNLHFVSKDSQYPLSQNYIKKRMIVGIGPIIYKEENQGSQNLDKVQNKLNQLIAQNENAFKVTNQLQLIFYFLNTLQPISVFLLLNALYPPQLYKFYQLTGTFIYPKVPDFNSHNITIEYEVFGEKISNEICDIPDIGKFKYLGFCQSILVNIPILLIKQAGAILIIAIISFFQVYLRNDKQLLVKIKTFLIQKLNSELEVVLTITFICIFIQFLEFRQSLYSYRMSFYTSLILILFQIVFFCFNWKNVSKQDNDYSVLYTERIQAGFKNKFKVYYFQFQTIKKYLYLATVCIFYNNPLLVCSLCATLFLLSSISTLVMQAYISKISRIIKFLGEILFTGIWLLHIQIIIYEKQFQQNQEINDNDLEKYINIGSVIMWMLLFYNLLFLIQFLQNIIKTIRNFTRKKQNDENYKYIK